jgi:hypothetical protein
MLRHRRRSGFIGAWLGVIALGFNALVPIHMACDIAHAVAPAQRDNDATVDRDFVACLLTLLTGHPDEEGSKSSPHSGHGDHDCAVCGAIATLTGFAPAGAAALVAPVVAYVAPLLPAAAATTYIAPLPAYRSRAPPTA